MPSGAAPDGGVLFSTVGRNAGSAEAEEAAVAGVFDVLDADGAADGFDRVCTHHTALAIAATKSIATPQRVFDGAEAGGTGVARAEFFLLIEFGF